MIIDINKQRVDSELVELFELVIPGVAVENLPRFTTYPTAVKFYDRNSPYTIREYIPLPIEFSGYEQKSEGAYSRPTISFANVLSTFKNGVNASNDDLIGKKLIRRKTLFKYLADTNSTIGASGSTPIEQPQQVFFIDRIERENVQSVTFELTSGFDLQNVTVPNRYILANTCTWLYQGVNLYPNLEAYNQGGCIWKISNNNPGFEVLYDKNNRPIVSGIIPDMPTSGNIIENYVYKVNKNIPNANRYDYYQALFNFTKDTEFETDNFRRCRFIDGDWNSAPYITFREGKLYNPVVRHEGKIWVAVSSSENVEPGTDEFAWERLDTCGKKLSSCALRFRAIQSDQPNVAAPKYTEEKNNVTLPYGGFPGAKRFNR